MRKTRYIILTLIITFAIVFFSCANDEKQKNNGTGAEISKISDRLLEEMESISDTDIILVEILLEDIDHSLIEEELGKVTDVSPNDYLAERQRISKRLHSAVYEAFIEEQVDPERRIIRDGGWLPCVIEATKEEIKYYASLPTVIGLDLYNIEEIDEIATPE